MILFDVSSQLEFNPGDVVGFHSNHDEGVAIYYEDESRPTIFPECDQRIPHKNYNGNYNENSLQETITEVERLNNTHRFVSILPIFIFGKIISNAT